MTLKTGRKCTWDDIDVGEVFAHFGCVEIAVKTGEYSMVVLATDYKDWQESIGVDKDYVYAKFWGWKIPFETVCQNGEYYKLPLSVQRLWKEE